MRATALNSTQGLPAIKEEAFLKQVLSLAKLFRWKTAHFRPARTASGWRTAVQGDGKGWPDLSMVRGERLIFAELKRDGKQPTAEQTAWLAALKLTGAEVYVWFPADLERIAEVLR